MRDDQNWTPCSFSNKTGLMRPLKSRERQNAMPSSSTYTLKIEELTGGL